MRLACPSLVRFVRDQIVYIVVSVVVGAVFWAIGMPINSGTVLVYTLCYGNLLSLAMDRSQVFFSGKPFPFNWMIFLSMLLIAAVPVYLISSVIVWLIAPPSPQTLSHLVRTGWKFPILVTFIWGFISFFYHTTKGRLERRNKELERSVEKGAKQLEMQEQELERAREIQQSLLPKEIPQLAGFEVAGAWLPARTVSGDYYDVFKLDEPPAGHLHCGRGRKGRVGGSVDGQRAGGGARFRKQRGERRAVSAPRSTVCCARTWRRKVRDVSLWRAGCGSADVPVLQRRTSLSDSITDGACADAEQGGAVLGVFPAWEYKDA